MSRKAPNGSPINPTRAHVVLPDDPALLEFFTGFTARRQGSQVIALALAVLMEIADVQPGDDISEHQDRAQEIVAVALRNAAFARGGSVADFDTVALGEPKTLPEIEVTVAEVDPDDIVNNLDSSLDEIADFF